MFKSTIAILALTSAFAVSAASIGSDVTIGTSHSNYSGYTQGVENKLVVTDSQNSLGGAYIVKNDVMDTNSKYGGSIHGSSNKVFTSVTMDGATGTDVTYSNYAGTSNSGSHIKYVDKYTSSGWEDNVFSGPTGSEVTTTDYSGSGKTVRNVNTHSNSANSGWNVEW